MNKTMLSLLTAFSLFCMTLSAHTPHNRLQLDRIYHCLFEKHFLASQNCRLLLTQLAESSIEMYGAKIKADELVERFKEIALSPEFSGVFIESYKQNLSYDEAEEALKLVESDLYKKYYEVLDLAGKTCYLESKKLMDHLAKTANMESQEESPVLELNDENFLNAVNESQYLIIDVYAPWCGPCKRLTPIFEELHREFSSKYRFAKIDGDKAENFRKAYNIQAFPTILFLKNGQEVTRCVGYMGKERLSYEIDKAFAE